jgi:hypothetical protein
MPTFGSRLGCNRNRELTENKSADRGKSVFSFVFGDSPKLVANYFKVKKF